MACPQKAKILHPDTSSGDKAAFVQLLTAYQVRGPRSRGALRGAAVNNMYLGNRVQGRWRQWASIHPGARRLLLCAKLGALSAVAVLKLPMELLQ